MRPVVGRRRGGTCKKEGAAGRMQSDKKAVPGLKALNYSESRESTTDHKHDSRNCY